MQKRRILFYSFSQISILVIAIFAFAFLISEMMLVGKKEKHKFI